MSGKSVFVTGATGFLGGTLVRVLLVEGWNVVASGRQADRLQILQKLGARILPLDLSDADLDKTKGLLDGCSHMVHCAALSSPWGKRAEFVKANIVGTQMAISLARQMNIGRFVHISTPSVYFRFADQEGVSEDQPLPRPVNAYAETKAAAEQLVLAAHELDPVILRPRGIYGAGDKALLPRLLDAVKQRPLPLMRNGAGAIDLTHVDDVVGAILTALKAEHLARHRIFNISGGTILPIKDVVEAACARAKIKARWRKLPVGLVMTYARGAEAICKLLPNSPEPPLTSYSAGLFAYRQSLDISRSGVHLGWTPKISFEEGLERTFASGNMGARR